MKQLFLFAIAVICLPPRHARADEGTAEIAYNQAEELRKQGKWASACPLYQASYRADPQLGVLLHLADCYEHAGMIASAWVEFTDAVDLAHQKKDSREASAQKHADLLAPKVSRLYLKPPPKLIPGLVVTRDGTDLTVLVGTAVPTDPGDHEIAANAPGYLEWKTRVSITTPGATTTLDVPALEKVPEKPIEIAKPVVHEGTVKITAPADAEIRIDSDPVGTGHYEGTLKSGGHMLRVTAPGMRMYQAEITILDGETRPIDVLLEKEPAVVVAPLVAPPPPAAVEDGPSFEVALSTASGVKMRSDDPLVLATRLELAFRIGRHINFGLFTEYGSIQTNNACGLDMPGPTPSTPFDFGTRNQFTRCSYLMPGLQLYIHVLPNKKIDPYFGLAPGFRFGFVDWKSSPGVVNQSSVFPGIVVGGRAGVDYHPTRDFKIWEVGAFIEAAVTVAGQEATDEYNKDAQHYVTLFGGLRSSLAF
ncbi:MAG: hypothetical protein JWO36_6987 [Myxococcales bacterium]|nr:hypothetical protein [Myxococcales bacterium]